MRSPRLCLAAGVAALLLSGAAAPAFAEYGALARDNTSGKFGLSWGRQTQQQAEAAAMKDCGGGACKIIFRTRAHQCGAIAAQQNGKAWGAAYRNHKDAAALAAMTDCQKHTGAQCKVQASGCNR